jgi:hypothetical protein
MQHDGGGTRGRRRSWPLSDTPSVRTARSVRVQAALGSRAATWQCANRPVFAAGLDPFAAIDLRRVPSCRSATRESHGTRTGVREPCRRPRRRSLRRGLLDGRSMAWPADQRPPRERQVGDPPDLPVITPEVCALPRSVERTGIEPVTFGLQSRPIARPRLTPTNRIGIAKRRSRLLTDLARHRWTSIRSHRAGTAGA